MRRIVIRSRRGGKPFRASPPSSSGWRATVGVAVRAPGGLETDGIKQKVQEEWTITVNWLGQQYWELVKRMVPDARKLLGARGFAILEQATKIEADVKDLPGKGCVFMLNLSRVFPPVR
jgi:hypothetical protein